MDARLVILLLCAAAIHSNSTAEEIGKTDKIDGISETKKTNKTCEDVIEVAKRIGLINDSADFKMDIAANNALTPKETYVFLVAGEMNALTVGYPAVLINSDTLVTFAVHAIEEPLICDSQICAKVKEVESYENYTYWMLDAGIEKHKLSFFKGDLESGGCKLNRNEEETNFTKVENTSNRYYCERDCMEHDVVICAEQIAGILQNSPNEDHTFIFHNISDILEAGGFAVQDSNVGAVRVKKPNRDHVFMLHTGDNKTDEVHPAALINPNTVISYHVNNTKNAEICDAINCTKVDRHEKRGNWTFWTATDLHIKAPRFFGGNITRAACNLNRSNRKTKFALVKFEEPEYKCKTDCDGYDVVLCDNLIAGILAKRPNSRDVFTFYDIRTILELMEIKYTMRKRKITKRGVGEKEENMKNLVVELKINVNGEWTKIHGVYIKEDMVATYLVKDANVGETSICEDKNCVKPDVVTTKGTFTYWILKSLARKDKPKPKFFQGDISKSTCKLNRANRRTNFEVVRPEQRLYTCSVRCKDKDVVVCNGKTAGFITATKHNRTFEFHEMAKVLNAAEFRIDRKLGAVPMEKPSLTTMKTPQVHNAIKPTEDIDIEETDVTVIDANESVEDSGEATDNDVEEHTIATEEQTEAGEEEEEEEGEEEEKTTRKSHKLHSTRKPIRPPKKKTTTPPPPTDEGKDVEEEEDEKTTEKPHKPHRTHKLIRPHTKKTTATPPVTDEGKDAEEAEEDETTTEKPHKPHSTHKPIRPHTKKTTTTPLSSDEGKDADNDDDKGKDTDKDYDNNEDDDAEDDDDDEEDDDDDEEDDDDIDDDVDKDHGKDDDDGEDEDDAEYQEEEKEDIIPDERQPTTVPIPRLTEKETTETTQASLLTEHTTKTTEETTQGETITIDVLTTIIAVKPFSLPTQRPHVVIDWARSNQYLGTVKTFTDEGSSQEIPAVLIDSDTVASFQVQNVDGASICFSDTCAYPTSAIDVKGVTLWKIKKPRNGTPEVYYSKMDQVGCTKNIDQEYVEFLPVMPEVYACSPSCKVSDIIFCDGKVAAIVTDEKMENVGRLEMISDLLTISVKRGKGMAVGSERSLGPSSGNEVPNTNNTSPKREDAIFVRTSSTQVLVLSSFASIVSIAVIVMSKLL